MKIHLVKNTSIHIACFKQNNLVWAKSSTVSAQVKTISTRLSVATPLDKFGRRWDFSQTRFQFPKLGNLKYRSFSTKDESNKNEEEERTQTKKPAGRFRLSIRQRITARFKILFYSALLIVLIALVVVITMTYMEISQKETITDELKPMLVHLRTLDGEDETENFKPDDSHISIFDTENDIIAQKWKVPIKSIFRFDGSVFEISKIEHYPVRNLLAVEWKKARSDPENEDLDELFHVVLETGNFEKESILSSIEYRFFKMATRNGKAVCAGTKDVGRNRVTAAVQIFDMQQILLFSFYYSFMTKDGQQIKRERREDMLDKAIKLFDDIANTTLQTERSRRPANIKMIKGVRTDLEEVWHPYPLHPKQ
mmetsp:Transcript_12497/g.17316  ORF Transcript_12497/g.17316 Transcript_12497/m.17316 type:complete len:367 (-) Transcript_12497:21-1121(-)